MIQFTHYFKLGESCKTVTSGILRIFGVMHDDGKHSTRMEIGFKWDADRELFDIFEVSKNGKTDEVGQGSKVRIGSCQVDEEVRFEIRPFRKGVIMRSVFLNGEAKTGTMKGFQNVSKVSILMPAEGREYAKAKIGWKVVDKSLFTLTGEAE